IVSPKTAERLGLQTRMQSTGGGEHGRAIARIAELAVSGKTLKAAVWPQPGHVDDSITLYLGYGREKAGKVAHGTGFNTYAIRTAGALWNVTGAGEPEPTADEHILAGTQAHFRMEGRRPARQATRDEYEKNLAEHNAPFAKVPKVSAPEWQAIDQIVPGPNELPPERWKKPASEAGHNHGSEKKEEEHNHDGRMIPLSLYPPTNK